MTANSQFYRTKYESTTTKGLKKQETNKQNIPLQIIEHTDPEISTSEEEVMQEE